MGGNINAMNGFIGSPYFPTIEDGMKTASVVEKNLAMLKAHNIFDKVAGIILGKHEQYDDLNTGKEPLDLLLEQLVRK